MNVLVEVAAKVAFLVGALAVLFWASRATRHKPLPTGAGIALVFVGLFVWLNFGTFHESGSFVHRWDQYHYTLSSKYYPELGHDGLYVATAEASEELGRPVPPRIRDLRTGRVVDAETQAAHRAEVRQRFSDARWSAFREDLSQFEVHPWAYMDHGYNAPPPLTAILRLLTNNLPVGEASMVFYALLDIALILGAMALIGWAFGVRAAWQCALLFGVSGLSRYFWNGGSILRYDWFFAIVAATCLLRKERVGWAAVALGYACAVRVFPLLLALPVMTYFLSRRRAGQDGPRCAVRFAGVMALTGVVLVGVGVLNNGRGVDAYAEVYEKLVEHDAAAPPNNVGLRTFFITSAENLDGVLVHEDSVYETNAISADVTELARQRRPLILFGTFLFLGLAAWLGMRARDAATALLIGLVAVFGATALTCYYWSTLALLPLLSPRRGYRVGLISTLAMYLWGGLALFMPALGWVARFGGALVLLPCAAIALLSLLVCLPDAVQPAPAVSRPRSAASSA